MEQLNTRLVIIEGIMGSGKSTTARGIASRLERTGRRAQAVTENTEPHPVRGTDGLDHWYQPWLDVTPVELIERSLAKWRTFVAAAQADQVLSILDGQLFHGDLTNLMLMGAGSKAIKGYCNAVEEIVRPMTPLVIYFYQSDIARAIRSIAAERGNEWVKYQVDWKLQTPYSLRFGWAGLEGLIALYKDYRALTDELYGELRLAKLAIENSQQTWEIYYERIMRELLGHQWHEPANGGSPAGLS
jgi:hypothetical protein